MTALPTVDLDPPTISMTFGVNDSPLAGRDGTFVRLSCPSTLCAVYTFAFNIRLGRSKILNVLVFGMMSL